MSTFLGIKYDLWHGIFAAFIQIVGITTSFLWLNTSLQAQMLIAVGLSSLINFSLQAGNEAFQLKSKNLIKNYGSLKNAQANSANDWKMWITGWFAGTGFGITLFILIDKIF